MKLRAVITPPPQFVDCSIVVTAAKVNLSSAVGCTMNGNSKFVRICPGRS